MVSEDAYYAARDFRDEVRGLSRRLRQLDPEIRKQTQQRGRELVAEPMRRAMAAGATRSPYYPKVISAMKAMGGATPTVKTTAAKKVFSGGASTRDVVPGAVWAHGGKSSTAVAPTARRRGYKRRTTTQQFAGEGVDFLYGPVRGQAPQLLAAWHDIVDAAIAATGLED